MTSWLTAQEIADAKLAGLPATKRGVQMLAEREGWAHRRDRTGKPLWRERTGRGGGKEWHVSLLPTASQLMIHHVLTNGQIPSEIELLALRLNALEADLKAIRKAIKAITGGAL